MKRTPLGYQQGRGRSHPSWVCGLKLKGLHHQRRNHQVTPFVGVWIETNYGYNSYRDVEVTPFVGVWIETRLGYEFMRVEPVTPFVGVWIETVCCPHRPHHRQSHPSWVCGLKPLVLVAGARWWRVTPFVGVWIETCRSCADRLQLPSHPSWVCGLKHGVCGY